MCLNLYSFVDNPFTDKVEINYKKLYEIAYEQQRLMDDLVDLELEAVEKIIEKIENDDEPMSTKNTELSLWKKIYKVGKSGRRTGSGLTALHDMLAALGVKYDSDEALEITDKVMKTKMEAELDCTIDLSILRGSFEGWDSSKEFVLSEIKKGKNKFYQFLHDNFNTQAARMKTYGRRNISFSTIAPTGSVSILCGTTSGCEPLFMPYYMRRKKINSNDENTRVDFVDDNGDKWQEYPVLHSKFKDWMYILGYDDKYIKNTTQESLEIIFKQSPWYKSTANDINWEYRLKMQEILQKYTSHSISSTINLPEDTSVDIVSQIYLKASQMGLKGITIYREGSRSGVLIDSNKKQSSKGFEQHDSPKRPKVLTGEVHKTTVKGTEYLVAVGFMENHPYEVFAIKNQWNIKGNHLACNIIKVKNGRYDIEIPEELLIEDFTNEMTPDEEDLTRMISTSLRHGAKIDFVVQQLNKSKGSLVDFSKAIARMLSKHVSVKKEGNCPECKTGKLIMQEGCKKCDSCTYSAC